MTPGFRIAADGIDITRLARQHDCTAKVADGLPPAHTDRHIHPNKTAAEQAARARLAAFNRSTAGVRLEMPGRSDLFAERMINAQGVKNGLDGEYLVDSREQLFTQSGWSTTIEWAVHSRDFCLCGSGLARDGRQR